MFVPTDRSNHETFKIRRSPTTQLFYSRWFKLHIKEIRRKNVHENYFYFPLHFFDKTHIGLIEGYYMYSSS